MRAWKLKDRGNHHARVVAKLQHLGLAVDIRIIAGDMDEIDAFLAERRRIEYWRAQDAPLVNKTDGGDGVSGFVMPPEARAKMSAAKKGRPGRATMLGRKHSPETIEKMRAAHCGNTYGLGRTRSDAAKQKTTAAQAAFYATNPNLLEAAKDARKRALRTPTARAKRSAISKKMWQDSDHRAARSEHLKKRWQDPIFRSRMLASRGPR